MDLTGFEPATRIVNSDVVPPAFVTLIRIIPFLFEGHGDESDETGSG